MRVILQKILKRKMKRRTHKVVYPFFFLCNTSAFITTFYSIINTSLLMSTLNYGPNTQNSAAMKSQKFERKYEISQMPALLHCNFLSLYTILSD